MIPNMIINLAMSLVTNLITKYITAMVPIASNTPDGIRPNMFLINSIISCNNSMIISIC